MVRHNHSFPKHGLRGTPAYHSWDAMKQRCNNPKTKAYANYGGRGIKVCSEWESFLGFFKDMGECPPGCTLERKDSNGDYCKDNCTWATRKAQNNNTRRNHRIDFNGEVLTISQWAERLGMERGIILRRLQNGWSIRETLTLPLRGRGQKRNLKQLEFNGKRQSLSKWSAELGIQIGTLWSRLYIYHMPVDEAFSRPPVANL